MFVLKIFKWSLEDLAGLIGVGVDVVLANKV